MYLKVFFLLTSILSILSANSNLIQYETLGRPFIKNYSYMDYKGHNQVWGAVQDKRGILYFVNSNRGILEYDGKNWKNIKLSNNSSGRSIDIDKNGVIYVGGVGDFGYLKREHGKTKFISLINFIPKKYKKFEYVWECVAVEDGVYFGTDNIIYRWHDGKISIIESKNGFHITRKIKNKAYTRVFNKGLMEIKGDTLKLVNDGEKFNNSSVNALIPYDNKNILVASREEGLFLYDGNKFKKFKTKADEFLAKNKIYDGKELNKNEFIIATNAGAVILYKNGEVKQFLNKDVGIRDNFITNIFIDNQNNLWLSLNNGIAKVEYSSPFSIYSSFSGIKSSINFITRYKKHLYISTMNGIYRERDNLNNKNEIFEKIEGIDVNAWKMIPFKDSLLIGTNSGIYEVKDSKVNYLNIINDSVLDMVARENLNTIYVSTSKGLELIEFKNGEWLKIKKIKDINVQPWSLSLDNEGNVWGSSETGIVFRVDKDLNVKKFGKKDGLIGFNFFVSFINNKLFVSSSKGIFSFDEKLQKFKVDEDFKNFSEVSKLISDANGNIWIRDSNPKELTFAKKIDNGYKFISLAFKRIGGYRFEDIYPDSEDITWFGGAEGLIRYDSKIDIDIKPYFSLINEVLFDNQKIYGNDKNSSVILHYSKNNIKFKFSAPYFVEEEKLSYQVYLKGYDDKYSNWIKTPFVDYTNLKEGDYTFYVKAKNIYGIISKEDSFKFKILPPWYRTWWAYSIYIILSLIVIYLIVLYQVKKSQIKAQRELKKEQEYSKLLENRVAERTKELNNINNDLQKLSNQLSKYLSPQLYNSIFTGKKEVKIEAKRKKLTIFFSDIKNFTKITEHMEPEDLTHILNHYLNEMSTIALKYGATIDKFIGDAIMIFFGDPESRGIKEDAFACVSMAIEMKKRMEELRINWLSDGVTKPFEIRMGINTGYCTVGNFGSDSKLDYTIVGNSVNLASRLESSATVNEILISEETYLLIKDKINCTKKEAITVKGFKEPVQTYEINTNYCKNLFKKELEGFNLSIDFDNITKSKNGVIEILETIVAKLKE